MLDLIDSLDEQKRAGTLERTKKKKRKKKRPEVQRNNSESHQSTERLVPVNKKVTKMVNFGENCFPALEVLQSPDLTTVIDMSSSCPTLGFPKIEANQRVRLIFQFYI